MALMIHQQARERLQALLQSSRTPQDLRRQLEQLLDIYPNFAPALGALADVAEKENNFPLALQYWQHALTAEPRNCDAWLRLARLKQQQFNENEAALQIARKALTIEPAHKEALAALEQLSRRPLFSNIGRKQPLVSAVVSTFKSARFIRACLEDLERQTIADQLEIIVVDSNSPQDERSVVEEFQKRYPNIVYIRTQERETVYGAWNRGARAARGKYVTNANTDDRHRIDAFEVLARTLDEHPEVTLVYADCLITPVENETMETTQATRRYNWLEFNAKDLFVKGCFCGPQPMWRRDAHGEHGYFDAAMISAGDYEFWLRLAQNRKFLHVPEVLGLYLESPTSVEHANRPIGAKEIQIARDRYQDCIMNGKPPFRPKLSEPTAKVEIMTDSGQKAAPSRATAQKAVPPVAKVGRLNEARELFAQKDFEGAWAETITAIHKRPFHPEAYLLLAEIALAAGDGKSAKHCAQRAHHFAPRWSEAKQFLNKTLKGDAKLSWLDASQITQNTPRLSVCLIVKNEERFLAQCLKSVRGLAAQIIVVDTGSTDRTVEIAREFGAEIYSFAWCDDFAAARNAALEHANGEWVLMLDADEELPASQHAKLLSDMKDTATIAYRLPLVNAGQENEGRSFVPRLFRNAPEVFFTGRIHEQVFSSLLGNAKKWGLKTALGSAELVHHGYTKELVRDRNKIERNLKLLRAAIEEDPTDVNLLMNLGLELVRSDELSAGIEKYREAYDLMSAQATEDVVPELREVLLTQFTSHLYKIRAHEEAIQILGSPLAQRGSGLTSSLHFALGLAHFELKQFSEAADQMRQCLTKRKQSALTPINTDILTAAPQHCLALSLAKLGETQAAEKTFIAALAEKGHVEAAKLDYAKFLQNENRPVDALNQLHGIVAMNSRNVAAWRLGGEIALSRVEFLEFAVDWTAEAFKAFKALSENPVIATQRAEALMLSSNANEALPLWERIWSSEHDPRTLAALILCEASTGQRGHVPNGSHDEQATSLAFVEWYQKLIAFRARTLLEKINGNVELLSQSLPSAAQMLQNALADVAAQAQA